MQLFAPTYLLTLRSNRVTKPILVVQSITIRSPGHRARDAQTLPSVFNDTLPWSGLHACTTVIHNASKYQYYLVHSGIRCRKHAESQASKAHQYCHAWYSASYWSSLIALARIVYAIVKLISNIIICHIMGLNDPTAHRARQGLWQARHARRYGGSTVP